ncbi:MAG TPA: helix-turn-helix domain-containing protein [Streptosporangiaceae bacterium]
MTEQNDPGQPGQPRRPASNVELLKALADPLRLNMLYALTRGTGPDLPVRSVKELAAELGEPQTKLYRHIKHLESAGLIRAVSSRLVSGIVEQRYQATHTRLVAGEELTEEERDSPEVEAMAAAALEMFRRKFFEASRPGPHDDAPAYRRKVLAISDGWVTAERAAAIRDQLRSLGDELAEQPDPDAGGDLVPVNLLLGYFSPDRPPAGRPAAQDQAGQSS